MKNKKENYTFYNSLYNDNNKDKISQIDNNLQSYLNPTEKKPNKSLVNKIGDLPVGKLSSISGKTLGVQDFMARLEAKNNRPKWCIELDPISGKAIGLSEYSFSNIIDGLPKKIAIFFGWMFLCSIVFPEIMYFASIWFVAFVALKMFRYVYER